MTLLAEASLEEIVEELDRRGGEEGAMVVHFGVEKHDSRGYTYRYRGCMARILGWLTLIGDDIRECGFQSQLPTEEEDDATAL